MKDIKYRCLFPNCPRTFRKEEGKPNICIEHRQFVADLVFALNNLGPPQEAQAGKEAGPKIFVPKPGMSAMAIEEARRAAGKGS